MRLFLILSGICILCGLHSVASVDLPPISCPKHFQYLSEEDGEFIGKITLFNLPMEAIYVDVILSQYKFATNNYYGNLTLYEDVVTTENNLKAKKPVTYRVSFPRKDELPKLTKITVNGIKICSATSYPKPSEGIALAHQFYPSDIPENERTKRPFPAGFVEKTRFGHYPNEVTTAATTKQKDVAHNPLSSHSSASNSECGRVGIGTANRIFGGTFLRRGEFPWLVAIYRKQYTGLEFICGGSLVSSRTVLTAAHCFKLHSLRASEILAYLGRHNLENYSEEGFVTREIDKLKINPDYDAYTYPDADLALMILESPVSFNEYIQPICLWNESDDNSLIIGQIGVVAGWGEDENGHALSSLPKRVKTDIVSEADCLRSVESFRALTSPRTICAGKRDGTGPCMGDSGGGLMIKRDGRWMIRGVVSAGQTVQEKCNLREYVVYCDVAKHMSWVQRNLLN